MPMRYPQFFGQWSRFTATLLGVIGWLSLLTTVLVAQPNLPPPERITDRQGLPQAFVPAITQDRQGFIWVATRDGLCRYDGHHFKVFQPDPNGKPSLSFTGLDRLFTDHHGRIWITSEQKDIDVFDPRTETFTNISRRAIYRRVAGNEQPYQLYVDRADRLWVSLWAKGLLCLDQATNRVWHFRHQPDQPRSLGSDSVMQVSQAPDGTIWIATRNGLERFDETTRQFRHYQHQPGQPGSLPDNQLRGLQIRANGEVLTISQRFVSWLNPATGLFGACPLPAYNSSRYDLNSYLTLDSLGRLYFQHDNTLYRFSSRQGLVEVEKSNQSIDGCVSLFVDRSQVLWVGTRGAGIRKYDLRGGDFQQIPYRTNFYQDVLNSRWLGLPAASLPPPAAFAHGYSYDFRYTISQNRYLWSNMANATIYRTDLQAKRSEAMPLPTRLPREEANMLLATDPQQRVWAINGAAVWCYDEANRQWVSQPYRIPRPQTFGALTFVVDKQALWFATESKGLWRLDRATGQWRQYVNQPRSHQSLSSNSLFCLSNDPTDPNRLWIGTFGGGLCAFDKRTGTSRRITQADGLPNNVIYSVIPDQQGYLWMGTNKGICRLNRRTFATRTFTHADGLLADEFNRFHWLHLPPMPTGQQSDQGERIIMGGLTGITAFYPRQVREDTFQPPVELTELQVNNQPVSPALLDSLPIQAVDHLTLPYNLNFITAKFAALEFNRPDKNRYRYRLEGAETDWKQTDQPVATYTNLLPGSYVLVLNASNTSGQWSRWQRRLAITIRPPLWATWWAYLLYGLALGGLIVTGLRASSNRLRQSLALQRRETDLNRQETEQLRAVDELKSHFFANITHEFRTPLTLILGPIQHLSQQLPDPTVQYQLATIDRNANQLLGLVNQLLDLSRLEAGALPVVNVRGDLVAVVAQTVDSFRSLASTKGIELTCSADGLAAAYWFDADKVARILYNLLANAFKFTDIGWVRVQLTPADRGIALSVADSGRGMTALALSHIFDRFFQAGSSESVSPGTGIGLSLVRELVTLQGGSIRVQSEPGQGSCFTIDLPYQAVVPDTDTGLSQSAESSVVGLDNDREELPDERPLILLVEDNDDLARFIADSLPTTCQILRAANGREGLALAQARQPDLVLSDVLMPVMDGYTLCRELKAHPHTHHLPVILLTAKATQENRLEGLELGADDYLTKPFQVAELQLRVRNQLDTRRRFRDRVRAELNQPATGPAPYTDPQPVDSMLQQLYEVLEEHLEDSSFGPEQLVLQLGMSRMSLYRKLKVLTGLTPAEVIRLYRLKRATELLQGGLGVAETAYKVGFETASHFGKVFRDQYQMTPSQFARQHGAA